MSTKTTFTFDDEFLERAKAEARKQGFTSFAEFVRVAITEKMQ